MCRTQVIELDGGQHNDKKKEDEIRTQHLKSLGYRVLRFWNSAILKEEESVLAVVYEALNNSHPNPLPEKERGKEVCVTLH